MIFLVRKINRAKWGGPLPERPPHDIPADAITSCMRTESNCLSFWDGGVSVDGIPNRLDDVVIAVASAGDTLGRVDVVWLPQGELEDDAIVVLPGEAITPFAAMSSFHLDAEFLTYQDLGAIGVSICNAIAAGRFRRYSKAEVKRLIVSAIEDRRVDAHRLNDSLRTKLIPSL